ncbi:MAG: hypothetical protein KF902_13585 [Phycisphaeraceae bacterium]|nr:hypothetical protein [Phycisphaeraceae bacterium]
MSKIELILFLLIIGSSAIGWIVRKLKEQAHIRQTQQALERQRLDALRTGRNLESMQGAPGAISPMGSQEQASVRNAPPRPLTPEQRLQEIMLERQRRLEELRRRAAAQAQAGSAQSGSAGRAPVDARARAQMQIQAQREAQARAAKARAEQQARAGQSRGQPARTAQGRPVDARDTGFIDERQRREQIARSRAEEERKGAIARSKQDAAERRERQQRARAELEAAAVADAARGATPVPAGPRVGGSGASSVIVGAAALSPAELRRAIVMNEILSPPRSLRDDL